jgi:hypothetical protein
VRRGLLCSSDLQNRHTDILRIKFGGTGGSFVSDVKVGHRRRTSEGSILTPPIGSLVCPAHINECRREPVILQFSEQFLNNFWSRPILNPYS